MGKREIVEKINKLMEECTDILLLDLIEQMLTKTNTNGGIKA